MPNKTAEQIVNIRRKLWLQTASSHAYIEHLTDDELLLWLAVDALDLAELDLQQAIDELHRLNCLHAGNHLILRIRMMVVAFMRTIVAVLRILPPTTWILPFLVAQMLFAAVGAWWLGLVIHAPYPLLGSFALVNIVAFAGLLRVQAEQVLLVFKFAKRLALSARKFAARKVFLAHPTVNSRHNSLL